MATPCQHCTADTAGQQLCTRCQTTTRRALFNIAAYHADLFNLPARAAGLRRSSQISDPTGSAISRAASSDPIEDAAAEAKTTLTRWMRRLVHARPQAFMPRDESVDALARVLTQQLTAIASQPWAGDCVRDLLAIELRLRRIVEANKGRWYAGVCGTITDDTTGAFCPRVLYADPDKATVRCPACHTTWPVRERRLILLEQARDVETNIAVIARAALTLIDGEPSAAKLERRIQNWADRGKLTRRGHVDLDGHVRKVYRVGDVLDLLLDARTAATKGRNAS